MKNCKAAKFNQSNACIDGKCKWPGVCSGGMARPDTAPAAQEVPPSAPEEVVATDAPADKPKRSRKAAK